MCCSLALKFSHSLNFQALKCRFPNHHYDKIHHQRSPKFGIVAAILNMLSSQAIFLFMTSFHLRHFVQLALDKCFTATLGYNAALKLYYFGPNMLQTPKMKAVKIEKWIIGQKKKKNILQSLWRMQSQLQVFLLPANFNSDRIMSHKHTLAGKYSSK